MDDPSFDELMAPPDPDLTVVVNRRREAFDVYIGRGSKWGNPYRIGVDGNRDDVIGKYRWWIAEQPFLLDALGELRGKRLGCYCKPERCHGDVLRELVIERFTDAEAKA